MKGMLTILLSLTMALSLLAGCGAKGETQQPAENNNTKTEQPAETKLSGAVSLNGSASMEKVVGVLGGSSWLTTAACP